MRGKRLPPISLQDVFTITSDVVIKMDFFKNLLDWFFDRITDSMGYMQDSDIGLNVAVRVIMVTSSVMVIVFLFRRMLRSQIKESSFLMWTLPAALLFVYGMWPELTYKVADMTHMAYGYALVVTVPFIALLYYLAFKQMCQISAITSKVVELGSVVSIQKHEIEELHRQLDEMKAKYEPNAGQPDTAVTPSEPPASPVSPEVEVIV